MVRKHHSWNNNLIRNDIIMMDINDYFNNADWIYVDDKLPNNHLLVKLLVKSRNEEKLLRQIEGLYHTDIKKWIIGEYASDILNISDPALFEYEWEVIAWIEK